MQMCGGLRGVRGAISTPISCNDYEGQVNYYFHQLPVAAAAAVSISGIPRHQSHKWISLMQMLSHN